MYSFNLKTHYNGGDLITNILKRSNIDDKEGYLNPSKSSVKPPFDYKMMRESIEVVKTHIEDNKKIGILVDCDVDGYTSAAIIYKALSDLYDSPIVFHQKGKQHGLTESSIKSIINKGINLLIIPDASSNDYEYRQELFDNGIITIVIDHHLIEDEGKLVNGSKYTVNNQRSDNINSNNELTGAGMCLKFSNALQNSFGLEQEEFENYDLAAIGQIGDMFNLDNEEVRYIIINGLENINAKMIQHIIDERVESLLYDENDKLSPIDIAFMVAPLINAVTRVGTQKEKEILFKALVENNNTETFVVERRRKINGKFKDVILRWNIYEYVYDTISSVKNRQDTLVRKVEQEVLEKIDNDGGVAIAAIGEVNQDEAAVIGLVANRLVSRLDKPTLLLRDQSDNILTGSGRGKEDVLDSLKDWCDNTKLMNFAAGHDNAMGVSIDRDKLPQLIEEAKKVSVDRDKKKEDVFVDLIEYKVDTSRVQYGHYLRYLAGNQVEQVLFGYKNIRINKDFIRSRGSVTTLWEQGLEFIIFNDHKKVYNKLKDEDDKFLYLDIVGRPNVSYWGGRKNIQIIVEEIQLSEG